jgi:hypothetical protein
MDDRSDPFVSAKSLPSILGYFTAGQFLDLMGNESLHGLASRAQPDKACAEVLRVQHAGVKGRPQQRKACCQHPPSKFVERAGQ